MKQSEYDRLVQLLVAAQKRIAELEGGQEIAEQIQPLVEVVEREADKRRAGVVLGAAGLAVALAAPVLGVEYERWRNGHEEQIPVVIEFHQETTIIGENYGFVFGEGFGTVEGPENASPDRRHGSGSADFSYEASGSGRVSEQPSPAEGIGVEDDGRIDDRQTLGLPTIDASPKVFPPTISQAEREVTEGRATGSFGFQSRATDEALPPTDHETDEANRIEAEQSGSAGEPPQADQSDPARGVGIVGESRVGEAVVGQSSSTTPKLRSVLSESQLRLVAELSRNNTLAAARNVGLRESALNSTLHEIYRAAGLRPHDMTGLRALARSQGLHNI